MPHKDPETRRLYHENYEAQRKVRRANMPPAERAAHLQAQRERNRRHKAVDPEGHRRYDREHQMARRRADPEGNKKRTAVYRLRKEEKRTVIAGRPRPRLCEVCGGCHHRGIVFEHDHNTNKFRGWTCDRCNKVLGLVEDSPELLRALAVYVESHGYTGALQTLSMGANGHQDYQYPTD